MTTQTLLDNNKWIRASKIEINSSTEMMTELQNDKLSPVPTTHHQHNRQRLSADPKILLTYTKFFFIAAYIVFIGGSALTLNELIKFIIDDNYVTSGWLTALILLVLGAISFTGLWASLKEDSCLLIVHGVVISVIFVLHVILLFYLKNACDSEATRRKCYRNLATPPGVAPILIAISELAIAICALFMALVIESEKKRQNDNHIIND